MSSTDDISSTVLREFDKLPQKRKPIVRPNGAHEWVPLSGIVAQGANGRLHCLSLATGMKCLPASKLSLANGVGIHDWHAEVLAIRAFNYFVLQECKNIALHGQPSPFLRLRSDEEKIHDVDAWEAQPFAWREDVTLHMYCTEAPCGDASMELIMASQEDASPWALPTPPPPSSDPSDPAPAPSLPGRGYFSQLGVVRRKPARGDAPPTASKSCSDKLALKQCTSLLSSVASLLVSPRGVYLSTLVLPAAQFSDKACRRAFSGGEGGRMSDVAGRRWEGGYGFAPMGVMTTTTTTTTGREFAFSRRSVAERAGTTATVVASNLAAAWAPRCGLDEGMLGGVLQGRKAFDLGGASALSRRRLWGLAVEVAGLLAVAGSIEIQRALTCGTYQDVKNSQLLAARRKVKEDVKAKALAGWIRNEGDDSFTI